MLVSTTDNASPESFTETVLANQEIPYLDANEWQHYTVDLSKFDGQKIYVALRHTTEAEGVMEAFYDDFTFNHIGQTTGIKGITAIDGEANVMVYTIDGKMVTSGKGTQVLNSLAKGLYVVKVTKGNAVSTMRYLQK